MVELSLALSRRRLLLVMLGAVAVAAVLVVLFADWLIDREADRFVDRIEDANIAENEFGRLTELARSELPPDFIRGLLERQDIDPATAELVITLVFGEDDSPAEPAPEVTAPSDPAAEFARIVENDAVIELIRERLANQGVSDEVIDQTVDALTSVAEEPQSSTTTEGA